MKIKLLLLLVFAKVALIHALDVKFRNINEEFGVSLRETSDICKDKNGFIWTASKVGVLRVSEGDCRIYQLPYKTADMITVKMISENNRILAYSNNGQVFEYDEVFDRFNFVTDLRKRIDINYLVVNDMKILAQGAYLIATSSGLFIVKDKSITLLRSKITNCKSMTEYTSHNMLCIQGNELIVLDSANLKACIIGHNSAFLSLNITKILYTRQSDCLWIGTATEGIYLYHFRTKTLSKLAAKNLPNQPVLSITTLYPSNNVLVGIDGQGIWELSSDGTRVLNVYKENVDNPQSLRGDGVYDIYCDNNSRIWVSTYTGGLSYYDQKSSTIDQITHRINVPASLCNNNVNKVLEDKKGNIWFATNNGISSWNRTANSWKTYYQNKQGQAKVFLALTEDNKGNIWAGTYSSGVYVIGANGSELMHIASGYGNTRFSSNFVFDLHKDSQGDIWLGGIQSDLACFNSKTNSFRLYANQPIKALADFKPGKILLGCSYGLLLLDKETGNTEFLFQGYTVQDICVLGNDIWVATSGDGLLRYHYKNKSLEKINTSNGLISNHVNSILYDNGFFWLGTENGLCRFKTLQADKYSFLTFYSLSNLSFNVGAKAKLRNGNLIFGSSNGAVQFHPAKLLEVSLDAKIYLQDVKVSGRSIRLIPDFDIKSPVNKLKELVLDHNENTLDFELIPIGVNSKGVKYSWIMQGLENSWTVPNDRKAITYTNIPPGYFKLRIKMYDNTSSHVLDEKVLVIHIIPPFWATWWFRMIAFLLLSLIGYTVLKFYKNKLTQLHTEDKIRFFTTTAHDIRTSLTLIQGPIEELNKEYKLSEKGKYFLNLATEQSDRLSFVATQLLDFEKVDIGKGQLFEVMVNIPELVKQRVAMFEATARKYKISLTFSTNSDTYLSAIDELKVEKVIDNLISNAIKYSHPNSKVDITLQTSESQWVLEVKDYGLGISENAQNHLFKEFYRGDNLVNSKIVGSGIGLLLVKNYVNMHGGVVHLSSVENVGSVFTINIPYKKVENESPRLEEISNSEKMHVELSDHQIDDTHSDKKLHIMVVEDNADLQNFIKYAFEPVCKVTTAGDGKQAWLSIQKKLPDLVISDVMMPEMDGFELCKLIKSTFDTAHIPVILLTALSDKTKQLEGLKLGADDYITKPFDVSLLKQRIYSIEKNREVVREKALKIIRTTENQEPVLNNEQNDLFVRKAVNIVKDNIANCEFGKDEFAAAMNASSSLLYKKIKALTGQSPVDFIKIIRLDYSIELLHLKKYTVTEVSELCGFSSVGYFSTVFKKHFGKSPTEI